tara:strand:+ start:960 stop:3185 length:2226 start_codon:yes stop_codon:yes gene_type:complete
MYIFRIFFFLCFFCSLIRSEDKLRELQKKADNGDVQAAYDLAEALYWADGVERDLGQAADYAHVGALKGNPLAKYRYAVMQLLGHGVNQDVKAGLKLLAEAVPAVEKLAEGDNPDALFKMGKLYHMGLVKTPGFNPDNEKANANFREASALGNVQAAYWAGELSRKGIGAPQDSLKASVFYKTAADEGFALAAFTLWIVHAVEGQKTVSQEDALRYLKQAAESGLKEAQREFGKALGEGKLGLEIDGKEALRWIRRAAAQGDASSQHLIGEMYFFGSESEIKKDLAEAYFWFSIAVRSNNKKIRGAAKNRLDQLQELIGKRQKQFFSEEEWKQVNSLKAKQLDLLKRVNEYKVEETTVSANNSLGLEGASTSIQLSLRLDNLIMTAESGDREAMYSLGDFYLSQKEPKKGETWLLKSAQKGFVSAMEALGDQYIRGGFGEPDFEKGSKWLKKSAAEGSTPAMIALGRVALAGRLPKGKAADAVKWFMQAADKGDAEAQTLLGELLYTGDVVKQDLKGGLKWIQKAADQNYSPAQGGLAIINMEGKLNGPNYKEAAKWARLGAMQGDARSQRLLGFFYTEGKGILQSKLPKRIDHMRHAYRWLTLAQRAGLKGLESEMNFLQKRLDPSDIKRAIAEADQFVPNDRYNPDKKVVVGQVNDLELTVKEANKGKAQAQIDLARRFALGDGVEPDLIKAYVWYTLALNQGKEEALLERSKMIKDHGMGIDEIIDAKKQVRVFKPKR